MLSLYDYLYRQESQRGEKNAHTLRWGIAGILFLYGLIQRDGYLLSIAALLILYNLCFLFAKKLSTLTYTAYISVTLESLALSLSLYILSDGPAALQAALSPFLWMYMVLLYSASMRFSDALILYSSILNILGMNTVYLLRYLGSPDLFIQKASSLPDQILRTCLLMALGLLLLNRPRIIRRILRNQQIFFEKMRLKNLNVLDQLDRICSDFSLSRREKDVLKELLRGKTYRMIADELCISVDTVKTHIKNLYKKLKINSRNELFQIMQDKSIMFEQET